MIRALPLCLLLAACVPVLVPPTPQGAARAAANTPPPAQLELEIHALVNRHRETRRLPPLEYDEQVAEVARQHSRAMASRARAFGHADFDARVEAVRQTLAVAGLAENVARDSRTGPRLAAQVVQGWLSSAKHRENIEGLYDLTGVGVAVSPGGDRYFTQLFVTRRR